MSTPVSRSSNASPYSPYGFLLTGGRRTNSINASPSLEGADGTSSAGASTVPSSLMSNDPMCKAAHAKYLAPACEYIVPPQINPREHDTPSRCRTLFVGQLRFETSPGDVRWMLKHLSGVTAMKVEARGPGCFIVYLATEADAVAVRSLNRRVLMDHEGFWFARTAPAVDAMLDYVETVLPRLNNDRKRSLHLPLDAIVVEDTRSRRVRRSRRPNGIAMQPVASAPSYAQSMCSSQYPSPPTSPHVMAGPTSSSSLGFHRAVPDYVVAGMDPQPQY